MTAVLPRLCSLRPVLKEDKPKRVTPSVYTHEMLLSTEERLANTKEVHSPRILELLDMSETTHHKSSMVDLDQPLFQPYPSELVFQNFTASETYKLQLRLLNMDKVPRRVRLEMQDSEFFRAHVPDQALGRIAPSCCATFSIFFSPQENKDYHHTLVFVTDRERFAVAVRAIGPRAILNFRDELRLPICPVKGSTERLQQVINVGNSTAKFELRTQRPFAVTPSCGTLEPGENLQVVVTFNPMNVGDHSQDLLVHYHTGEDVYVTLFGTCEELDVHLKSDSLMLKSTYISLANVHTVSLTNRSDSVLQYHWSVWPTQEEEDLSLLRETSVWQKMEVDEREQVLFQCLSDPTLIYCVPLLDKALQVAKRQAAQESLALSDDCITLEPAKGEIWPKMTQQFTVVFKPKEAEPYQETIYCNITGRQSRLPLTIRGEGLGPQLWLDYSLMNMKNVFMGDRNCYEVLLSNKGLIDASFKFSRPNTFYGRCFSFSPEGGVIPFGSSMTVRVTFQSHTLGTFSEDLLLTVEGQPELLTLTFRGCVVGPTFHFDVLELNFGDVAFGFPQTMTCTLFNTSFVPMNFVLRVLGDGQGSPSVTSDRQVCEMTLNNWQGGAAKDPWSRPVEFSVSPAADSVRAMSDVTIKVTLCSNTVRTYRLALVVDVEGVGEEIKTLPINARCVVPEVSVETPLVDFHRCFLNHPHEQHIRVSNPSALPACYGLLDQEYEESPLLLFFSSKPRGVIPPHSSEKIPVTILAKFTGRLHHVLRITVFGSSHAPLEVILSCVGQGPVVYIQNPQLDFGRIPVLKDATTTLLLLNHSPIPASFKTTMSHRKSFWRVLPSEGEVPPDNQLELQVVAHLRDTTHFQEKMEVSIQDGQTHAVLLSATGTGTTIVSDRPFAPSLDLGTHFSHGPCQYHFKLTNRGQRTHWMNWGGNGGFNAQSKTRLSSQGFLPPISSPKKKDLPLHGSMVAPREDPVFSVSPRRVKLLPGCSVDMVLTGFSDTAKVVQELLVCRGTIGDHGCIQKLMSVDVSCRFVTPLLSFSSKQLNFSVTKVPGQGLRPMFEKLLLKNISSLSVSVKLSVGEPFSLSEAPEPQTCVSAKSLVLGDGQEVGLWICFDPGDSLDQLSRTFDESLRVSYLGHPHQDVVELHAEVHFPNLHFSTSRVDFGCVFNYTEAQRVITMTNCSKLPVSYHWTFLRRRSRCSSRETVLDPEEEEEEEEGQQKSPDTDVEDDRVFPGDSSAAFSPAFPSRPSDQCERVSSVQVEEVFDVLPMHGHLQPGENQLVSVSFCGHGHISSEVVAQCHVDGGPRYDIQLSGEASGSSYSLDPTHIDFGLLLFDHQGEAKVVLRNTGRVGFTFEILQLPVEEEEEEEKSEAEEEEEEEEEEEGKEEGKEEGAVNDDASEDADQEKSPEEEREREEGEGEEKEREEVEREKSQEFKEPAVEAPKDDVREIRPGQPMVIPRMGYIEAGSEQTLRVLYIPGLPEVFEKQITLQVAFLPPQDITVTGEGVFPRILLNLPRKFDESYEDLLTEARAFLASKEARDPIRGSESDGSPITFLLTQEERLHMEIERLLVKANALAMTKGLLEIRGEGSSCRKWYKLSKFILPDYILDFGYVILGRVHTHTVDITNTGLVPVSFYGNFKPLIGKGFTAEFDRVTKMPCRQSLSFTVKFDPKKAQLPLGEISVIVPIQVVGGPTVHLRLCAVVTMPAVTVSSDSLHFDPVQCGMCQVKMIQLSNREPVPCYWNIFEDLRPVIEINKFLPPYLRKKLLDEQPPTIPAFQVIPNSGSLDPDERLNVQIKFIPTVEDDYNRKIIISVKESSKDVIISAWGKSEEPKLEFCPLILEMKPCLPASTDIEGEVIVKNPCSFPIEFFCLEFDTQYMEEEKVLRMMPGYADNVLLLPTREPGESLPKELVEYYDKYCCNLTEEELTPEINSGTQVLDSHNHRGPAIILYGGPMTDESGTPSALADHYEGVCLNFDTVVTDVLRNGISPASLAAKKLLDQAATQYYEKEAAVTCSDVPTSIRTAPPILETLDDSRKHSEEDKESSVQSQEPECSFLDLCLRGDAMNLNNLLPTQLLADIMLERFQFGDCFRAMVIHGLKSIYTPSLASTLQVILKALQDRRHIYVVSLYDSYFADMIEEKRKRQRKRIEESVSLAGSFVGPNMDDDLKPAGRRDSVMSDSFALELLEGKRKRHRGRRNLSEPYIFEEDEGSREVVASMFDTYVSEHRRHHRRRSITSRSVDETAEKNKHHRRRSHMSDPEGQGEDRGRHHRRRKGISRQLSDPVDAPLRDEKKREGRHHHRKRRESPRHVSDTAVESRTEDAEGHHKTRTTMSDSHTPHRRGDKNRHHRRRRKRYDQEQDQSDHEAADAKDDGKQPSDEPTEEGRRHRRRMRKDGATVMSDSAAERKEDKPRQKKGQEDRISLPNMSMDEVMEDEEKERKDSSVGLSDSSATAQDTSGSQRLGRSGRRSALSDNVTGGATMGRKRTSSRKKRGGVTTSEPGSLMRALDQAFKIPEPGITSSRISSPMKHLHSMKATPSPPPIDKLVREKALVIEMQAQLTNYEKNKEQVNHILKYWDRTKGMLLVPLPEKEAQPEKKAPERRGKKGGAKPASPAPSQLTTKAEPEKEEEQLSPEKLVPHIVLNITEKGGANVEELVRDSILPSVDEVLDDLGLGPHNTPTVTLSVVPFPKERHDLNNQTINDWFTFLDPAGLEDHDDKRDSDEEVKGSASGKDKKGKEAPKNRRHCPAKTRARGSGRHGTSAKHEFTEHEQHLEILDQKRNQSLTSFRWVVSAHSEMVLRTWFYSDSLGKYKQRYNFEIVGNKKHYRLLCRGTCAYPSISRDYMTLFANSKVLPKAVERMAKTYVINQGYFEFGPLLCNKSRERYKNNGYVENTEKLVIHNDSGLETEVQFHFQYDTQASTYLLDPPSMTLQPDEKQELTIWAYPTRVGQVKDSVLCCVKDNPDLVNIDLSCWGVWPQVELEGRFLHFDRILLHREERRTVIIHNRCGLCVFWRLQDLEFLGDEFTVPQDQGILSPYASCVMVIIFGAKRPVHVKKMLRLEVSDVEKILGVVQTENIKITAEAYDINLVTSPPDGLLNFGIIRVFEESKLTIKMKNHGKYEIAFQFLLKQTRPSQPKLDQIFTIIPESGVLKPHEKATIIQVVCTPNTEVSIRDQPILPCQVIEPNIGSEGEAIATLTFKITVKSVYSRFKISPPKELHFGPMAFHGLKKSLSFTIENIGIFESQFSICLTSELPVATKQGGPGKKALPCTAAPKTRRDSLQKDCSVVHSRIAVGVFAVSPCTGLLLPASQQTVIVDCAPEQLGSLIQNLLIDISDRDPSHHPDGIPYRLLAEVCKPSILLDMASIFEENYLCHTSQDLLSEQFHNTDGVFVLNENKLSFNKVLVGRTAKTRLKFSNNSKVPCVINLFIKYNPIKVTRNMEVFDVSTPTVTIGSQSHSFIYITFNPRATLVYHAVFEASMEGFGRATTAIKIKVLEFDLTGEGSLPSVSVIRPSLRNNRGNPVLHFRRLLVGRRQSLPLVLLNDGHVPAQVHVDLVDKQGVFTFLPAADNDCSSIQSLSENSTDTDVQRALVSLGVGKKAGFEVILSSDEPVLVRTKLTIEVEDNKHCKTLVKVFGETYKEVVTLDNIRSPQETHHDDNEKGNYEVLNFGDCHVACRYEESFTMTNHSETKAVRFEWPPAGQQGNVFFSPQVGHLHAGCSKEVTVTFRSRQPVTLNNQSMMFKFCQLDYQEPIDQVPDWDDKRKTMELTSASELTSETQSQAPMKVVKPEPEPCCSVVDGSQRELELRIKAVCDYAKFSYTPENIVFKETMLYQTSVRQLKITNQGRVKVEYVWQVIMESAPPDIGTGVSQEGEASVSSRGSKSAKSSSKTRPVSVRPGAVSAPVTESLLPTPFSVEPRLGVIEPDSSKTFDICFSPLEVSTFYGRLVCSIPNLQEGAQVPHIPVTGESTLPDYHIDLEDSDYISGNRRDPEITEPLDPNTRILEFNALGISLPLQRTFAFHNPTSETYTYEWKCDAESTGPFLCVNQSGSVPPGKKVEMCFEYLSEQLDVVESPWSLVVQPPSLVLPFLFVGLTREPNLYLSRPCLHFGELVIGRQEEKKVDLVNSEDESFSFSFSLSSLVAEDQVSRLTVEPMSGTVGPKERLPLSVVFTPCRDGPVSMRLVLMVDRKTETLGLTVKAKCYAMTTVVQVQNPAGKVKDVKANRQDTLDFGMVGILERSTFNFTVNNQAKFSSEVNFEVTGPSPVLKYLEVNPKVENHVVKVGGQLLSSLSFCPRGTCTLKDVHLSIKIKYGPTFNFTIEGKSMAPNLEYSFTKFNFGKCFLYQPGMVTASKVLTISNNGELETNVQCQSENTSCLKIRFQPGILGPGAVMEVPVTFYPREVRLYRKRINFTANGNFPQQVDVEGEGVELKLAVANPWERIVKLTSVSVGQKVARNVVVVNRSLIDVAFTFSLSVKSKDLTFTPAGELNLDARGGSCVVHVQFAPREQVPPFEATLHASFLGLLHPLLTIQASCQ